MIKKLHFKLELAQAYFRQNFLYFIVGLAAGCAIFLNWQNLFRLINSPRFKVHSIGIEGRYTTKKLPPQITSLITHGLTDIQTNGKPIPSAITQEWDMAPDNQSVVFTLKPNLVWHDRKKLSAYDLHFKINQVEAKALNDRQIKFSLASQFSPLLNLLEQPILRDETVGLGSYQITKITHQEGYLKSISLSPQTPQASRIRYNFYLSQDDLVNAYKLGEIDEIQGLESQEELQNWPNTKITPQIKTSDRYLAIFINTSKHPVKQFRQALAYATPKTSDKNSRCLGPVSPLSWAYNESIKEYGYNPQRAQDLYKNNEISQLTLAVSDSRLLPQADLIKQAWDSILGLKTEITVVNQLDPDNYDVVLAYGNIPTDPDQYIFWHSTQLKTNITKLNNPKIDKLLEEGRQLFDQQERRRVYRDFQRTLLEESPAIFLSYPTTYNILRIK